MSLCITSCLPGIQSLHDRPCICFSTNARTCTTSCLPLSYKMHRDNALYGALKIFSSIAMKNIGCVCVSVIQSSGSVFFVFRECPKSEPLWLETFTALSPSIWYVIYGFNESQDHLRLQSQILLSPLFDEITNLEWAGLALDPDRDGSISPSSLHLAVHVAIIV